MATADFYKTDFASTSGTWTPSTGTVLSCIQTDDANYVTASPGTPYGNRWVIELNPLPGVPSAITVSAIVRCPSGIGVSWDNLTIHDSSNNLVGEMAISGAEQFTFDNVAFTQYDISFPYIYAGPFDFSGAWTFRLFTNVAFDWDLQYLKITYTYDWGVFAFTGSASTSGWSIINGANALAAVDNPEDSDDITADFATDGGTQTLIGTINGPILPAITDVQFFVHVTSITGSPVLNEVLLTDSAAQGVFVSGNPAAPIATGFIGLSLNDTLATEDFTGDWLLGLEVLLDSGEAVTIDWFYGTYNTGSSSGGGVGGGGQRGKNASFFLQLCGVF